MRKSSLVVAKPREVGAVDNVPRAKDLSQVRGAKTAVEDFKPGKEEVGREGSQSTPKLPPKGGTWPSIP